MPHGYSDNGIGMIASLLPPFFQDHNILVLKQRSARGLRYIGQVNDADHTLKEHVSVS